MSKLNMKRAARAAGAQPRAIAIYASDALPVSTYTSLLATAAFSAFLWALFFARAVILIS